MAHGFAVVDPIAGSFIGLITPPGDGTELIDWAGERADTIRDLLNERGALLFRGFESTPVDGLDRFLRPFSSQLLTHINQPTPRTQVNANVYTPPNTRPTIPSRSIARWPTTATGRCCEVMWWTALSAQEENSC